jgi:cytoskeleton protein RodZ
MNDANTPHPKSQALAGDGVNLNLTAGAMLRQAREAAGLHVAALALSMKVPVNKLEALEADQLDVLLDLVFVRALAASVCRALKIDPTPVLDKLPQNRTPRLDSGDGGINAPFHTPGQTPGLFVPTYFAKPGFIVALALSVGAAVLVLFPEIKMPEPLTRTEKVQPAAVAEAITLDNAPVERKDGVTYAPVDSPPAVAGPRTVPESRDSSVVLSQAITQPAGVSASRLALASVMQPEAVKLPMLRTGLVVFKAKGVSWVEVVDSKSIVQLRRLFAAGETGAATGSLPLSVVVGRADAMDVEVRGKPFDFTTVSKDGVARFEVK